MMRVNIFCCGRFHFHKYISYMDDKTVELVFSHKVGTLKNVDNAKNYFPKEYILYAFRKLLPARYEILAFDLAHWVWNKMLFTKLVFREEVDIDHFLCHGNNAALFRSGNKSIKLAQVVNAHPVVQKGLLKKAALSIPAEYRSKYMQNQYFELKSGGIELEAKKSDYLLAPSLFVKNSYVEQGFNGDDIYVLNYGLEKKSEVSGVKFDPLIGKKTVRILCVGLITPRKGQHLLLSALGDLRVKFPETEFIITLLGGRDQSYFNYLLTICDFEYISHLDNSEMLSFMSEYDIFVLPSFEDGFAVTVSEALSAGIPVVVSDTTGAMDIFSESSKRYSVFEHGSQASLLEKMSSIYVNGYDVEFSYGYSWEGFAERLSDIYLDIIDRNKQL